MKKIFITGGTGTVGKAFITKYYKEYKFYSFSRNEKSQVALKRLLPDIEIIIGGIENESLLKSEVSKIKPDIIVHAAALKHVDTAEKQPSQAILTNIIGSYNLIQAAIYSDVSLVVGISTDKACNPENIYGQSKYIMEKLFLEANSFKSKFVCCRFGNVAWSNGSVIPFWLTRKSNSKDLLLTDKGMTRLMFSQNEAAKLIKKCIEVSKDEGGFILSKKMKSVNMFKMAKLISEKIKIIGLRPGEKLYEDLISDKELPYTYVDKDYILIKKDINPKKNNQLSSKLSSINSEEMTKKEMMNLIDSVSDIISTKIIDQKNY